MDQETKEARGHEFQEIADSTNPISDNLAIDDLNEVYLNISASLGHCTMNVRDVLELKRGSVVQLDKLAGEMTDIYVNGLPLAKGEVVVIGDELHVRIGELTGQSERTVDMEDLDEED